MTVETITGGGVAVTVPRERFERIPHEGVALVLGLTTGSGHPWPPGAGFRPNLVVDTRAVDGRSVPALSAAVIAAELRPGSGMRLIHAERTDDGGRRHLFSYPAGAERIVVEKLLRIDGDARVHTTISYAVHQSTAFRSVLRAAATTAQLLREAADR